MAVDLKHPDEIDFLAKEAFESMGIQYHNLPIVNFESLSLEQVKKFGELIEQNSSNVLVYCMSGNRVSALLALLLYAVYGFSKKEVCEVACKLGLSRGPLKKQLYKRIDCV